LKNTRYLHPESFQIIGVDRTSSGITGTRFTVHWTHHLVVYE